MAAYSQKLRKRQSGTHLHRIDDGLSGETGQWAGGKFCNDRMPVEKPVLIHVHEEAFVPFICGIFNCGFRSDFNGIDKIPTPQGPNTTLPQHISINYMARWQMHYFTFNKSTLLMLVAVYLAHDLQSIYRGSASARHDAGCATGNQL